MFFSLAVNV
jgi:hypothetical protein